MTMRREELTAEPDERTAATAAACLFRALADPSRLTILRHLALGEHRVVDLVAHLGLAQSTVSQHLACLAGAAWSPPVPGAGPRSSR